MKERIDRVATALAAAMALCPLPGGAADALPFGVRVFDANAHVVGDYAAGTAFVTLSGRHTTFPLAAKASNPAYLVYQYPDDIFFANADCTGAVYLLTFYIIPGTLPSTVQHRADGDVLYIADSRDLVPGLVTQSAWSYAKGTGECTPQNLPIPPSYVASSPPIDLAQIYTLPFTVK